MITGDIFAKTKVMQTTRLIIKAITKKKMKENKRFTLFASFEKEGKPNLIKNGARRYTE